jgi:hypothetical protein
VKPPGPSCPVPVQRTTRFRPQPDRLILQSQSLSRSYGSILPTSLTYIILTTRGCSPWRPAADMGTAQHENHTTALGFSRADNSTLDSARAAELYGNNIPISRQTVFRESKPYKEKTTLPRAIADVSEFVCVTALASEEAISVSKFGNINPIPFRTIFTVFTVYLLSVTFKTDFSDSLGPTDPCSTAVHMEPFSTLVHKDLTCVFATTTKICISGSSRQTHVCHLQRLPLRPSYS